MVSLPTMDQSNAVTGAPLTSAIPHSSLSGADIAAPYMEQAGSLAKEGDLANQVATDNAKKAAQTAVTKDEDGNIQVAPAPFIVGPAAEAYQQVAHHQYIATADSKISQDVTEARVKFEGNPSGFAAWSKDYVDGLGQSAPDPEMGAAVKNLATRHVVETGNGITLRQNAREVSMGKESIAVQQTTLENELGALAGGGDTSSPSYTSRVAQWEELQRQRVANPLYGYGADQARYDHSRLDSEMRLRAISNHISNDIYSSGGIDAAVKAAKELRTNPSLNLTPVQRDAAFSRVMADINTRARDDALVEKGVAQGITGVQDLALQGYPVTPERMGDLRTRVFDSKNPQLAEALAQTENIVANTKQLAKLNPAQLEATNASLDKTMRETGATGLGMALKDAGEKLLKNMRTEVGKDPLGWSARTGVMDVPPIEFGSKNATDQMAERATRAEIIAQHYGIAPTYLRPDEKHALEVVGAQGGDAMLTLARTLAAGFGDRAPKVMAEVANDAPALAHIGVLLQTGGNVGFATDAADAAKIRSDKAFKLPTWMEKPSDDVFAAQQARVRDVYGDAFALAPTSREASQTAARDAFFTRAIRNGFDPALDAGKRKLPGIQSGSEKAFDLALQESAGARFIDSVQYGGVATYSKSGTFGWRTDNKVLIPNNVRADRFKDTIGAITDDDLRTMAISPETAEGKAYTAADIRAAVPIATQGGYRFAVGDPHSDDPKYIRGADGKPFVLDFGQMEEKLRTRVPGAFLGSK